MLVYAVNCRGRGGQASFLLLWRRCFFLAVVTGDQIHSITDLPGFV